MTSTALGRQWSIPFVRLMEMNLPDGRSHLGVMGTKEHIESYLSRFGVVPAIHQDAKKLVRPATNGEWEILDPDACPELSGQPQPLTDTDRIGQTLTECRWQLVGYTVHRVLVRLLFDQSGEGHWMIAQWGYRDIAPDLRDGYFTYTLRSNKLAVKWPDGAVGSFDIAVSKSINVSSGAHGKLVFFDFELGVDSHIVPKDVRELDGWPLTYWGTKDQELAQ